jgi:hypothetical protein
MATAAVNLRNLAYDLDLLRYDTPDRYVVGQRLFPKTGARLTRDRVPPAPSP